MSAGNPGIAAKDTKEETKSEREERILKEFIRGTTSIGFKIADESVEEILVSFSQELMHTIAKDHEIRNVGDRTITDVAKADEKYFAGEEVNATHSNQEQLLSPICTVRIDSKSLSASSFSPMDINNTQQQQQQEEEIILPPPPPIDQTADGTSTDSKPDNIHTAYY